MDLLSDSAASLINAVQEQLPKDNFIIQYIKNSYKNDPYRVVIELLLFFFAMKYILKSKTRVSENELTPKVNYYHYYLIVG